MDITTYYKYVGNNALDPGLIIGGYELAFLSNLLVAFVFKELNSKMFVDNFLLNKIHRDDGMLVTKENWDAKRFATWIQLFQKEVNELLQTDKLQFTLDIWMNNDKENICDDIESLDGKVTINKTNVFPFLDMKMAWKESELIYNLYFKENQQIKYLNRESTYKETVFHAIPRRIFHRLCSLATFTDVNKDKRAD